MYLQLRATQCWIEFHLEAHVGFVQPIHCGYHTGRRICEYESLQARRIKSCKIWRHHFPPGGAQGKLFQAKTSNKVFKQGVKESPRWFRFWWLPRVLVGVWSCGSQLGRKVLLGWSSSWWGVSVVSGSSVSILDLHGWRWVARKGGWNLR